MAQRLEDTLFAPLYWGFVASIFLAGITVVQAYIYFPRQNDKPLVRWTAVIMLVLDIVSSALIAYSIYYYLIPEFGSLVPFQSVTPELSAECLISAVITLISQLYFVYQLVCVKRLGKGNWLVIWVITLFAFLAAAGGIGCVASMYVFHRGVLSNRNSIFAILFGIAKGFAAITDIIATIAMCMFLTYSKSELQQTNSLLAKLIQFIIHRGALVTLIQALLLLTFYAAPNHLAWLAFHMNVTKLYANTFFAMLNARSHFRDKTGAVVTSVNHLTFTGSSGGGAEPRVSHSGREGFPMERFGHVGNNSAMSMNEIKGTNGARDMPLITKTVMISDL